MYLKAHFIVLYSAAAVGKVSATSEGVGASFDQKQYQRP